MDLGSRLANLSLAEIASMLNTKQQEVLLASISVAARFIQQLQAEEQQADVEQQLQQQQQQTNQHHTSHHHHHLTHQQQQQQQLLQPQDLKTQLHSNSNNQTQQSFQTQEDRFSDEEDDDDDEFDDDDDQHASEFSMDESQYSTCTGHSATTDAQTLLTIREFADELKHRRKSIRLSQKGAAQSLRAFTSGAQPCTDAIIYHFENLQLEPDRAIQLIPLLRDWLEWAEKHRLTGKQLPMLSAVTKVPRERKRKVVLFNEKAKQFLEEKFIKNNHPDRYQLEVISEELNIPTRSIRKWFTNRRQRKRFAEKFSSVS